MLAHIYGIFTYGIYTHGEKTRTKGRLGGRELTSLHLSQEEERGQQASLQSWEGKSSGSELNGREGGREGMRSTEEEAGMALEEQAL